MINNISDKALVAKIKNSKHWDHDIKFVDGKFVEERVKEYQNSKDQDLLIKIIENYRIYRPLWARIFAPYCDNDIEAGEALHDEIVWNSVTKFKMEKAQKANGKAFNAYCVSALCNQRKNLRSTKMSHKNSPRVKCQICGETVYQIDARHLSHRIDLERYRKMFPGYPLASTDGLTACPPRGERVAEITPEHVNLAVGYYTVDDFEKQYPELIMRNLRCPLTNMVIDRVGSSYPAALFPGFNDAEFMKSFPNFGGIFKCPFSGEKLLRMTQEHLDRVLEQDSASRTTMGKFAAKYPRLTLKARQVQVRDPYSNRSVDEITLEALAKAGTTVKGHVDKWAGDIVLDQQYKDQVTCPFTGKKTRKITRAYVEALGRTVFDFYHAACKFPLKRWQVRCAICGRWTDNIWDHLEEANHEYAPATTMEEFEKSYGVHAAKATVSTNAFREGDSGDSVHIADLVPSSKPSEEMELSRIQDVQDSIVTAAKDEMDFRIVKALKNSRSLEDLFCEAAVHRFIGIPASVDAGRPKAVRELVRDEVGTDDFDILGIKFEGNARKAEVMIPSKDKIKGKLLGMLEASGVKDAILAPCEA